MKIFRNLPLWGKYGIVFSALYCIMTTLLFLGSITGMAGTGESNQFAWIIIFSLIPAAWLLNSIGIKVVVSTSIALLLFINMAIFFVIGSLIGVLVGKAKKI